MKKHKASDFFDRVPVVRQRDVADKAGMSIQQVNNFAKGKRKPSAEQVRRMNKALDEIESDISANRIKE